MYHYFHSIKQNNSFLLPSLLAEREGFEPSVPVSQYDSLANCSFRPLRHLSVPFFQRTANVKKRFPNAKENQHIPTELASLKGEISIKSHNNQRDRHK